MSRAARTIFVFGLYLALTGLTFGTVPNLALPLLGLPEATEPWIRVVGVLAFALAYFFLRSAQAESRAFFGWMVHVRLFVFASFVILAILYGLPSLALFGLIDLLGATWTAWALRAEG